MNAQQERLIRDNPNLSNEVIAKLINVHRNTIHSYRKRNEIIPKWYHIGNKIPFFTSYIDKELVNKNVIKFGEKKIHEGSFKEAMISVDRLIYCVESNNRHLLKTLKQNVFENLSFLGR